MNKIEVSNVEDIINLSPQQMGMILLYLKNKNSNLNLEQISLSILGELNEEKFLKTFDSIIQKNQMLRTIFRWEGIKVPVQIILKKVDSNVEIIDISTFDDRDKDNVIQEIIDKDKNIQFQLDKCAFRVKLVKVSEKESKLIITNHHIIYDGWSTSILLQDFINIYSTDTEYQISDSTNINKYKNYIKYIKELDVNKHKTYWNEYLKGYEEKYILKASSNNEILIDSISIEFDNNLINRINNYAKLNKCTLASIFYYTWGMTLSRIYSKTDVVFDTTYSTRVHEIIDINKSIGLYINTIPLRFKIDYEKSVIDHLRKVSEDISKNNQYKFLSIKNKFKRNGLINSVVVIENYPIEEIIQNKFNKISIKGFEASQNSGYDITAVIMPFDNLKIVLYYNKKILIEKHMEDICSIFKEILINVLNGKAEIDEIQSGNIILENCIKDSNYNNLNCCHDNIEFKSQTEIELSYLWSEIFKIEVVKINRYSDFFELSGHSLDAILLSNKIQAKMNLKMSIEHIFNLRKLYKIAKYIDESSKSDSYKIEKASEKNKYLVSSAQRRMYLIRALNKDSITYNVSSAYKLKGNLCIDRLTKIFKEIIQRHEVLRTSFHEIGDKIYQRINKDFNFEIEYEVLDSESNIKEKIKSFIRPFNLSTDLLLRVKVLEINKLEHVLLIDMHHIISDGVSSGLLIKEFGDIYNNKELREVIYQYKDYSEWQNSEQYKNILIKQKQYWINEFKDDIPGINLPCDYKNNNLLDEEGKQIYFEVEKDSIILLKKIANEQKTSLFSVLLSCYFILLHKLSKENEIVVGVPVANRTNEALENVMGMFVNTLPIKVRLDAKDTFIELVTKVSKKFNNALDNQDYQLDLMYEDLGKVKKNKINLFNICFLLQNMYIPKLEFPDLDIEEYMLQKDTAKFDFIFIGTEIDFKVIFEVVYKTNIYKEDTMEYFISGFKSIIDKVSKNPYANISSSIDNKSENQLSKFCENLEGDM